MRIVQLSGSEVFRSLPTASLDRVLGRNVDAWLPQASKAASGDTANAAARLVRRLQNEMQMLLYTHPLNDARAARRQLPVNSFWISGTGALPAAFPALTDSPHHITVPRSLAQAVFRDDWAAYGEAWAALDAIEIAQLLARQRAGEAVRLTLCGERGAQTYETRRQSLWDRASSLFAVKPTLYGLEQL